MVKSKHIFFMYLYTMLLKPYSFIPEVLFFFWVIIIVLSFIFIWRPFQVVKQLNI